MINVSFVNLINGLLPYHKRLPKRVAFMRTFANKADSLMAYIRDFRTEALMLAYTNGQRFRLEKHLNDVFDKTLRRILLNDTDDIGHVIGRETENNAIIMGMVSEDSYFTVFGFTAEDVSLDNEIKITVPVGTNNNMVLEEVNKYKLAGIKVTIQN